jgi:hypothetical protein
VYSLGTKGQLYITRRESCQRLVRSQKTRQCISLHVTGYTEGTNPGIQLPDRRQTTHFVGIECNGDVTPDIGVRVERGEDDYWPRGV